MSLVTDSLQLGSIHKGIERAFNPIVETIEMLPSGAQGLATEGWHQGVLPGGVCTMDDI